MEKNKKIDIKISIIIPIYNSEKYLEECLNSLLFQSYKNIEIICVNDGSTDGSLEILNKYKDNIIIINKENTGVSDSRNIGIDVATGKYIMFVDADDYLEKTAIEKISQILSCEKYDFIKFNHYILNENNKIKNKEYDCSSDKNLLYKKLLNGQYPGYVWNIVAKREIIKNIKFDLELMMMEDTLFCIELLEESDNYKIINDYLYNYRIYENSSSRTASKIKQRVISVLYLREILQKKKNLINVLNEKRFFVIFITEFFNLLENKIKYKDFRKIEKDVFNKKEFKKYMKSIKKTSVGAYGIFKFLINNNFSIYYLLHIKRIIHLIKKKV